MIIGIGIVNTENELFKAENPGLRRCRTPSFDALWNLVSGPLGASRHRAALLTFDARSPSSLDGFCKRLARWKALDLPFSNSTGLLGEIFL